MQKKRNICLTCIAAVIFCGFLVLYVGQKKEAKPMSATDFKLNTLTCIAAVIFCGFLVLYVGQKKEAKPMSATDFKLNTIVKITIYDSKDPQILEGAMELCDKYEKIFSRTDPESELYRFDFKLNTIVKITIYDSKDPQILEGAMELCDKYEKIFSRTDPESELYRLNAGILPQEDGYYVLSDACAEVIKTGLFYSNLTHGAFDITVQPLSSLWDFTSEEKVVPAKEALYNPSLRYGILHPKKK